MPTDLAQLLITVTATGFDEVLDRLAELERAMGRVSQGTGLDRISEQLEDVTYHLEGMHDGLNELIQAQERSGQSNEQMHRNFERTASGVDSLEKKFRQVTAVVASFWAVVAVPRKFLNTIEGIASFNRQLTLMAINANSTKGTIAALGTAAEALGGSKGGVASFMENWEASMQGLRMGQGLGSLEDLVTYYGLDIWNGSGPNGAKTSKEGLLEVASLIESLKGSPEKQLDVKRRSGFDDGLYRIVLRDGVEGVRKALEKNEGIANILEEVEESERKFGEAVKELSLQWDVAKSAMLDPLVSVVTTLTEWIKPIAEWVKNNPKKSAVITTAGAAVGTVGASVGVVKAIRALFGVGGKVAAGAVANGAANVAGGAVGNIVGAGSAGRAGSLLGAGVGIGNLVANGLQAGWTYNTKETLGKIYELLSGWMGIYVAFLTAQQGIKSNKNLHAVFDDAASHLNFKDDRHRESYVSILETAWKHKQAMDNRLFKDAAPKKAENERSSNSITISNITITVNSDSADAVAVAQAVREELFRQINDAVDDATKGVKIL